MDAYSDFMTASKVWSQDFISVLLVYHAWLSCLPNLNELYFSFRKINPTIEI